MDIKTLEGLWPQFSQLIFDYLHETKGPEGKVLHYLKATDLEKAIGPTFSLQAPFTHPQNDPHALFAMMEKFLHYSVHTHHKFFMNQLYSGVLWPSLLGEILTTLINTSMSTYEVSPVGTLLEKSLVQKMLSMVGFSEGEGHFVTGGSNANLVALLSARNHHFPQVKTGGSFAGFSGRPVIFVSEDAHYSYLKAANVLGLGTSSVVKVGTNDLGVMKVEDLNFKIREQRALGHHPFFIGATAGTTVTGAFDPLNELFEVAQEEKLWFHVDGAYGGGLLFCEDLAQEKMQGREKADSFTWDAHKTMGVPLICSVILFKRKGSLEQGQGGDGGQDYLFHDYENSAYDLGPNSLQCGKRNDVLKLFLAWSYLGDAGYRLRMEKLLKLSQKMAALVTLHPDFHLMVPLNFLNICFQYRPQMEKTKFFSAKEWNEFNLRLRQRLATEGKVMMNYSQWKESILLRPVFLNPELDENDLILLIEEISHAGEKLLHEIC